MKEYRIKGSTLKIKANCLKQAIRKLVTDDVTEFFYQPHWYTHSNRKSWANVTTNYGYECIIEEV